MEIYKQHKVYHEELLKEFFARPKELQRLAFVGRTIDIPCVNYTDIIVNDKYAIIETGNIMPRRGLHGIFPAKNITFRWHYSTESKRCKGLSRLEKQAIKDILSNTYKYQFVKEIPPSVLSGSILRDILYEKITNPSDAIKKYGKRLGVKHLSNHVFELADILQISPIVIINTIDPAQLETCYAELQHKLGGKYGQGVRLFGDMVDQAYALGERINLKWSDARLREEHEDWSRRLMKLTICTKSEEPVWPENVVETFRQNGLELCNTEQRVFEEGYVMHHCVYTNYWYSIKTKRYLALNINLPNGSATIGLRLTTPGKAIRDAYPEDHKPRLAWFQLEQYYHRFNTKLTEEEDNTVREKLSLPAITELLEKMAQISVSEELVTQPCKEENPWDIL